MNRLFSKSALLLMMITLSTSFVAAQQSVEVFVADFAEDELIS